MNTTESGEHMIVLMKEMNFVVLCGHMHAFFGTCSRVCSHSEDRLESEGVEHACRHLCRLGSAMTESHHAGTAGSPTSPGELPVYADGVVATGHHPSPDDIQGRTPHPRCQLPLRKPGTLCNTHGHYRLCSTLCASRAADHGLTAMRGCCLQGQLPRPQRPITNLISYDLSENVSRNDGAFDIPLADLADERPTPFDPEQASFRVCFHLPGSKCAPCARCC